MKIQKIHSFLVHPAKNEEEQPEIKGTQVPLKGDLSGMLSRVFNRAPYECNIEIVFRPGRDGKPKNQVRDLVVRYVEKPTIVRGRALAARLQSVTTHRSRLGLFFLIKGEEKGQHHLVLSRFPADQGILATEKEKQLAVELLKQVFMKNALAYKSAWYCSDSLAKGFWDGKAVDKQITGPREVSDYWIREFLASELRTTGPAGTKRLAVAVRQAIKEADELDVRRELVSAAGLLRGLDGQPVSAKQAIDQFALSQDATELIEQQFPRPDLMDEVFVFERGEFERQITYRAVELDNGGLLLAEDSRFGEVFAAEVINLAERRVRYVTEGRVVDERLRKTR